VVAASETGLREEESRERLRIRQPPLKFGFYNDLIERAEESVRL